MGAKTKRILFAIVKFLGLMLLNLALAVAGFILYFGFTDDLQERTRDPEIVDGIFWFLLLIGIFLYLVIPGKILKRYGLGVLVLVIACLSHLTFYLNARFAREGTYHMHAVCPTFMPEQQPTLSVNMKSRSHDYCMDIEVPPENSLFADSVLLREDRGLFGMRVYTDHIRIPESENCAHEDFMTSNWKNRRN